MGAPVIAVFSQNPGGNKSLLNIAAAAVVKSTPGTLYRATVNTAMTTGGAFTINATAVFDYPTIGGLAEYLVAQLPESESAAPT